MRYIFTAVALILCLGSMAAADTGLIIAYGHELAIADSLTRTDFSGLDQDTLRLKGWPLDPLRCTNPNNYQAKALEATTKFDLTKAAQKYGRQIQQTDGYQAGVQAMLETFLLRLDIVANATIIENQPSWIIKIVWADGSMRDLYVLSPAETTARIALLDEARSLSLTANLETGAQYLRASSLVDNVIVKSAGLLIIWKSGTKQGISIDSSQPVQEESVLDQSHFRNDLIDGILRQYNKGGIISFGCTQGLPYQTYDSPQKATQVEVMLEKIYAGQALDSADTKDLVLGIDPILADIRRAQGGK